MMITFRILTTYQPVASICNCKKMRAQLTERSTFILFHHVDIIQMWKPPEGVYSDQYISGVCLSNLSHFNNQLTCSDNYVTRVFGR